MVPEGRPPSRDRDRNRCGLSRSRRENAATMARAGRHRKPGPDFHALNGTTLAGRRWSCAAFRSGAGMPDPLVDAVEGSAFALVIP